MTRTLDLLRNHDWNMQAIITDRTGDPRIAPNPFFVRIEPIEGPSYGTEKETIHPTRRDAYKHAHAVLGWADADAKFDALRAAPHGRRQTRRAEGIER